MSKYDDLGKLDDLRNKGGITEEEYQREKERILNSTNNSLFGIDQKTYLVLMHLSQFAGFIIWGLGFALPIIMWLTNKDNEQVNKHGKNIANFMLSMLIYFGIAGILCILLIGFPILAVLGLLELIFVIIAAVKAGNNEYWKYPLSIPFFS